MVEQAAFGGLQNFSKTPSADRLATPTPQPSNPQRLASSIADLNPPQIALCNDLLSCLATANMAAVDTSAAGLERRQARLWERVFRDWDTDCRIQHPRNIPPRERFPVIKRPHPGMSMEQMRARAMAHWNRGEIQRVGQHNIGLVVYWARRRLVKDLRTCMVVANPGIFGRTNWLSIPGSENLAQLVSLEESDRFVSKSGWATQETIADLRHVDI
jgi:hypothetical protein